MRLRWVALLLWAAHLGAAHVHVSPLARLGRVQEIRLQPGLALVADPAVLSGYGGMVNLSWTGQTFANRDDWVGLWCNGGGTPNPMSSAPVKYNLVSVSSTWYAGTGWFTLFVPNLRSNCQFFLLTGGAQFPLVVGASNVVSMAQPNFPTGLRLALADAGSMQVSWKTLNAANPAVFYRTADQANYTAVAAQSSTFGIEDMCEAPASDSGWLDPGTLHSAVIPTQPGLKYSYMVCGDSGPVCSPEATFVSPPAVGSLPDGDVLAFLAFGDMGNADVYGAQQHSWDYNNHGEINALNTTHRMVDELNAAVPPSLVLHIGDISYAVGFVAEWDQFLEQISPLAQSVPWMTAIGNHELGYSESWIPGTDSGGECGIPYSQYFRMPAPANTGAADVSWYSFPYGPITFVVMSTEHDFTKGSVQYAWLNATLPSIDRSVTPWVVFSGHRPMYVDSTWDTGPYSDQSMAALLRQHVEPLLVANQVDVALWGHHHTYQRTCPVSNEVCTEGAPVHLVIGMAGYDLTHNFLPTKPAYIETAYDDDWGYARFMVNATHMEVSFVGDKDGLVRDSVVLMRRDLV